MNRSKLAKTAGLMAVTAMIAMAGNNAHGALVFNTSGLSSEGRVVTAQATFSDLGNKKLAVTLVNTSPTATFGIAETLYSLLFEGATITGIDTQFAPVGSKVWDLTGGNSSFKTVGSLALPTYATTWDLETPTNPDGITAQGPPPKGDGKQRDGILSSGFAGVVTDGLGNANHNPYVQNRIDFVLHYSSLGTIGDVRFVWGTGSHTTSGVVVPEPTTLLAGALLLLPLGISTIRRLRKS